MLIVYKVSSGEVVENMGTNSLFPNGIPDEKSVIQYAVQNFGGIASDYKVFRLHDVEDSEQVAKTFTHEYTIKNDRVVFGSLKPIPDPEPQPPSDIEVLQQENAMLQMSVMEMTMYAASQDERLQGQEQAILELSMIVAGGM
ncbi:hypothetical protein [Bacillus sp. FJAT-22090]|uniref:hypothetical protein n=1 Tax=Bacillus sp. FJAT-22090 TaxID=1581038 RepID=UPI00119EE8F7|nr:hypothetical protein [Bacillus sp. FJAT-22090]